MNAHDWLELLKWALPGGVMLYLVKRFFDGRDRAAARRDRVSAGKKARERALLFLNGLPPEQRNIVARYALRGVHTMALDCFDPAVTALTRLGVLADTGRAEPPLDRFYTLRADLFEIIHELAQRDRDQGAQQ